MIKAPHLLIPPEWSPHGAIWTAWPTNADEWNGRHLEAARDVAAMVRALAAPGLDGRKGDRVRVLAQGEGLPAARAAVGDVADVVEAAYGDIWLRDTGPLFLSHNEARLFAWNGWGGKYLIPPDPEVGDSVCRLAGASSTRYEFILEGGAIDGDGQGNWLTTRQCLLNPNRNADWRSEADAEAALRDAIGLRHMIWLGDGLLNDHTDGHVDNIARFVAPGVALCQSPFGEDDPNAETLQAIARTLHAATTADGAPLKVITIPSPGRITDADGDIVPASHMNFIIGNASVVLPIYTAADAPQVREAVATLQAIFPNRRITPLPAHALLSGGGSFHCITQQQPADLEQGDA